MYCIKQYLVIVQERGNALHAIYIIIKFLRLHMYLEKAKVIKKKLLKL